MSKYTYAGLSVKSDLKQEMSKQCNRYVLEVLQAIAPLSIEQASEEILDSWKDEFSKLFSFMRQLSVDNDKQREFLTELVQLLMLWHNLNLKLRRNQWKKERGLEIMNIPGYVTSNVKRQQLKFDKDKITPMDFLESVQLGFSLFHKNVVDFLEGCTDESHFEKMDEFKQNAMSLHLQLEALKKKLQGVYTEVGKPTEAEMDMMDALQNRIAELELEVQGIKKENRRLRRNKN